MIGTSKLNGKVKTTIERTFIWVARILLIKSRVTFAEKKPKNNSKNKKLVNSSWKKGKKKHSNSHINSQMERLLPDIIIIQ